MSDSIVVKINMYEKPIELMTEQEKKDYFHVPPNMSFEEYEKQIKSQPIEDLIHLDEYS